MASHVDQATKPALPPNLRGQYEVSGRKQPRLAGTHPAPDASARADIRHERRQDHFRMDAAHVVTSTWNLGLRSGHQR